MEISIIIPVYNVERYIERCILSILSQTFQDFEVVIVNDSTPDQSMQIIQKYAQNDKRFVIINNDENMGLMWTRMVGYKNAKGRYFVFCDSDDYLPDNALEILYNAIKSSNATIAIGNIQRISDKGKKGFMKNKLSFGTDSLSIYKSLLTGELFHSLCGKIYSRILFDNNEYDIFRNQTQGEDGILFYQIATNIVKATVIQDIVYYYYVNHVSATQIEMTDKKLEAIIFGNEYMINYIKNNNTELSMFLHHKETISLYNLLVGGRASKDKIRQLSKTMDVDFLCSFKSLSTYYKGCRLPIQYILLNCKTARHFKYFLRTI